MVEAWVASPSSPWWPSFPGAAEPPPPPSGPPRTSAAHGTSIGAARILWVRPPGEPVVESATAADGLVAPGSPARGPPSSSDRARIPRDPRILERQPLDLVLLRTCAVRAPSRRWSRATSRWRTSHRARRRSLSQAGPPDEGRRGRVVHAGRLAAGRVVLSVDAKGSGQAPPFELAPTSSTRPDRMDPGRARRASPRRRTGGPWHAPSQARRRRAEAPVGGDVKARGRPRRTRGTVPPLGLRGSRRCSSTIPRVRRIRRPGRSRPHRPGHGRGPRPGRRAPLRARALEDRDPRPNVSVVLAARDASRTASGTARGPHPEREARRSTRLARRDGPTARPAPRATGLLAVAVECCPGAHDPRPARTGRRPRHRGTAQGASRPRRPFANASCSSRNGARPATVDFLVDDERGLAAVAAARRGAAASAPASTRRRPTPGATSSSSRSSPHPTPSGSGSRGGSSSACSASRTRASRRSRSRPGTSVQAQVVDGRTARPSAGSSRSAPTARTAPRFVGPTARAVSPWPFRGREWDCSRVEASAEASASVVVSRRGDPAGLLASSHPRRQRSASASARGRPTACREPADGRRLRPAGTCSPRQRQRSPFTFNLGSAARASRRIPGYAPA